MIIIFFWVEKNPKKKQTEKNMQQSKLPLNKTKLYTNTKLSTWN